MGMATLTKFARTCNLWLQLETPSAFRDSNAGSCRPPVGQHSCRSRQRCSAGRRLALRRRTQPTAANKCWPTHRRSSHNAHRLAYFNASRTPISTGAGRRFRPSRTAFQADAGRRFSVMPNSWGDASNLSRHAVRFFGRPCPQHPGSLCVNCAKPFAFTSSPV